MQTHDYTMHRGETFLSNIRLTKDGAPIDLTTATAKSQVRESPNGGKLVAEMEISMIGEEGKIIMMLAPEDSAKIEPGVYAWDIRISDEENGTRYYLGGKFTVLPSVTE